MRSKKISAFSSLLIACASAAIHVGPAVAIERDAIKTVVDAAIGPVMQQHGVPGMAVGIVTEDRTEVFNYGVASKDTGAPVRDDTLFEVGSVSKTFTATLASYAGIKGHLALTDSVSEHLPALEGSALGQVELLHLATHTPGGMPLQFPDAVTDENSLMAFFQAWEPSYDKGTTRTYANPSIGLLGAITAKAMGGDFAALVRETITAPLGLERTYLDVPQSEQANYAQGYTKKDEPIRMAAGVLGLEAYGVRTTAADLARFVEANMGMLDLGDDLRQAIAGTHTGYFRIGPMTQDLIWEQYAYPVELKDLVFGNSPEISYEPNAAERIRPPLPPQEDVLINKTGSTNGFGAYVAFVPGKEIGIVLLANKNYPNEARVTAAHQILTALDGGTKSQE